MIVMALFVWAACGTDSAATTASTAPAIRVSGYVHAGPVCPVMQDPPDPACDDRPVADALVLVTDGQGATVAEARTDATGRFEVLLPTGDYTLVPQAVDGLLGTADPQDFTVGAGVTLELDVGYDTGIR